MVRLLQQAITELNALQIDNENIKLILQSAIAAINAAVILTQAIKGGS